MADLGQINFSNEDNQEASNFTLFNEGETTFLITNSELKPFGEKTFLAFNVSGQPGHNVNKSGEISLAIIQPSAKGQKYCRNMLFSMAKATGFTSIPQNTALMHGRKFTCDVLIDEYKGNDGTMKKKNEFKGFRPASAPVQQQNTNPQTTTSQPGDQAGW